MLVRARIFWLATGLLLAVMFHAAQSGAAAEENMPRPRLSPIAKHAPSPPENPTTAAKVELGKLLFFDPRLSGDNTLSCAACHTPDKAFADGVARSPGKEGKRLARNSPTVLNSGFLTALFWDGRAASLEEQAMAPLASLDEMHQDVEELVRELTAVPAYVEQFNKAFKAPPSRQTIAQALAAFQRTLVSNNAPLDRYLAGDKEALSPLERRGMELFSGEAGCIRCHHGPLLSDGKFYRLGIGGARDKGRGAVTGRRNDDYKFRTPPLRDVAETAPYMHDGSLATLYDVVEFYLRTAPQRGPEGLPLDIEPQLDVSFSDIDALVAFLRTLSGEAPKIEPPRLP